ncbi:hypothetical protein DF186_25470, partial [Enterococcus hirae]
GKAADEPDTHAVAGSECCTCAVVWGEAHGVDPTTPAVDALDAVGSQRVAGPGRRGEGALAHPVDPREPPPDRCVDAQ